MSQNPNILEVILTAKQAQITQAKSKINLAQIKQQANNIAKPRDFLASLLNKIHHQETAVIAEIKKASPSKGVIREDFHPKSLAKAYELGGASCLSVLTDTPYFQGCDDDLIQAKNACSLPVLRKDFIIDPYQVYQSAVLGADCILLIVAAFKDDGLMADLSALAQSLGMAVLVEVHNDDELRRALALNLPMVGINNRNLKTFKISLQTTIDLLPFVPENVAVITESAILKHQDISTMQAHGVYGFLVGESLMRQDKVEVALRNLIV